MISSAKIALDKVRFYASSFISFIVLRSTWAKARSRIYAPTITESGVGICGIGMHVYCFSAFLTDMMFWSLIHSFPADICKDSSSASFS